MDIYTHGHTHTCKHVQTYMHIHTYMHTHTYACTFTNAHAHTQNKQCDFKGKKFLNKFLEEELKARRHKHIL